MQEYAEPELLLNSCKLLFDSHKPVSLDFIRYLRPAGLRAAYRDRIKASHPDRAHLLGMPEEHLTRLSQDINSAYDRLLPYIHGRNLDDRDLGSPRGEVDENASEDHFYRGRLPKKTMRFAMFLYYTQIISWRTLVNALVWQRSGRPLIGQIALASDLLDHRDISTIMSQSKLDEAFGETALRLNLLELPELRTLLGKQASYNRKIGRYFLETRAFSPDDLSRYLRDLRLHNVRIASRV